MATINIQRSGFTDIVTLFSSIADDLIANGFTVAYDGRGTDEVVTLEAGGDNDPLFESQPWRIKLDPTYVKEITKQATGQGATIHTRITDANVFGRIILGTPIQLEDDGSHAAIPNLETDALKQEYIADDYIVGLIDGILPEARIHKARPVSYILTITNRGIALSLTTDAQDEGRGIFWMCCQRLVNAITGDILVDGHSPVVCFYGQEIRPEDFYAGLEGGGFALYYIRDDNYDVYQMVVRESDVHAPAIPTKVNLYDNYIGKGINHTKQISISNDEEYVLTVPDGINTHRHLYHNDRMDMMTYISANVIPEKIEASVNMHGEATVVFVNGSVDFELGTTLVGNDTGARAVIYRIDIDSGDWATTDAAGVIYVKQLVGRFLNEDITSYDNLGNPIGSGEAITTALTYRKYIAQRCTGGETWVEDGYTEGSRVLFLTENGDI